MKELCIELGWFYSCFIDTKFNQWYLGINNVLYSKDGFPMDCDVIWEVNLNNG
jgi:hypothetical protein